MKRVQLEYHETTGEIRCVRVFDAAIIPRQELASGHSEHHIDAEKEPGLAEEVRHAPNSFRVHHGRKQLGRKVK